MATEKTNTPIPMTPAHAAGRERRLRKLMESQAVVAPVVDAPSEVSPSASQAPKAEPQGSPPGKETPPATNQPAPKATKKERPPGLTLASLRERIRNALTMGRRAYRELGRVYNEVIEFGMWADECSSPTEYFEKEIPDYDERELRRFGTTIQAFPDDAVGDKYAGRNLYLLVSYLNAIGTKVPEGDPGDTKVSVPQDDQSLLEKRFAECSTREIEEATKRVLGRSNPPAASDADKAEDDVKQGQIDAPESDGVAPRTKADETPVAAPNAVRELARRQVDLLNEGKLDEWEQTFAERCRHDFDDAGVNGRKRIRAREDLLRQGFPDRKYTLRGIYTDADTAVVETTFQGTHKGLYAVLDEQIPPTGNEVKLDQVQVLEVKDGQVVAVRTYLDNGRMLAALRHKPAAPADWKAVDEVPGILKSVGKLVTPEFRAKWKAAAPAVTEYLKTNGSTKEGK